jgi:hypothetical protein
MALWPPTPCHFDSQAELLDYLKDWGADNRYLSVIAHSVHACNYASIKCNNDGPYQNTDRVSNDVLHQVQGQKKTNCLFCLEAHVKHGSWTFEVQNPNHNYPASASDIVFASLRTLTIEQQNKVEFLMYAGALVQTIPIYLLHGDSDALRD